MITRSPWTTLYALLSGLCGLAVLSLPFILAETPVDVPAQLLVTVVVLVVSYFRVPIYAWLEDRPARGGRALASLWNVELALDGVLLLGITLAKGAAAGCWAAFIAGLVTPFVPHRLLPAPVRQIPPGQQRHADRAFAGLLDGGRNAISLSLGWLVYQGIGGTRPPGEVDAVQVLALGLMFLTFGLIRNLWAWPVLCFQGEPARRALERLLAPGRLAVELAPLPVALLVSATLCELGWANFLLLTLLLAGLGAVMRQMTGAMRVLYARVSRLEYAARVRRAVEACPQTINDLCDLARSLCAEVAPGERFELGLFDATRTRVVLRATADGDETLPPMTLPLTGLWAGLSEQRTPEILPSDAPDALPSDLPPSGDRFAFLSALVVPLLDDPKAAPARDEPPPPLGGIALLSTQPAAYAGHDLERVAEIARVLGPALAAASRAKTGP